MNSLLSRLAVPTVRRQVFYSFHYANDAFRVQQIRNIGAIEGNTPCSSNDWESVKRSGDASIQRWIDEAMNYRSCVVVLIGSETSTRKWVDYEIRKAWDESRGLFGIYIHNLNCPRQGRCIKGANPFESVLLKNGQRLSERVRCYDPGVDAYNTIAQNMSRWIDLAIQEKRA